jgi:hypothetical protein
MPRSREEILSARRRLRDEYGQLFDMLAGLLFREDPVGINFETNTSEYEPEAETILPRLRQCQSADDVRRVVHQEFVRWFGDSTAGAEARYASVASKVWELWQAHGLP